MADLLNLPGSAFSVLTTVPQTHALRLQKLKTDVHRQLIEGLDLSKLNAIKPERLRREVRQLAVQLTSSSPEMLNELEREKLVGENIAYGPSSPDEVVRGWLDSVGHCENIMDPRFVEMGIAYAVGHAPQGNAGRGLYWVQVLADPI